MAQIPSTPAAHRTTGNTARRYQAGVLKYRDMGYWVPDTNPRPPT